MKKTIFLISFLATTFLTAQTDTLAHLGTWEGEDQGAVGLMKFDSEGYAYFIYEEFVMGGPSFERELDDVNMTYVIDYESTPMSIDFVMTSNITEDEISRLLGILEFVDNATIRINLNFEENKPRPTEFEGDGLITFHRLKKGEKK